MLVACYILCYFVLLVIKSYHGVMFPGFLPINRDFLRLAGTESIKILEKFVPNQYQDNNLDSLKSTSFKRDSDL